MPSCRFAPPAPRDSAANLMLQSSFGLRRGNRILPLAMPWPELVLLSGIIGHSSPQLVSNRFSGTGATCPKDTASAMPVETRPYSRLSRRVKRLRRSRTNSGLIAGTRAPLARGRSEEHTSELQSLMRISYAVFCLKKKHKQHSHITNTKHIYC